MSKAREPIGVRFDRMFAIAGPDDYWLWQRATRRGYGKIHLGGAGGRAIGAHRFAWERANGRAVPAGLVVRHLCDVRACVNPAHLELGTTADNAHDAVMRGRHVVGADHPKARLTDADVIDIRVLLAAGHSQYDIATRFGVTQAVISGINTGRRWSHVQIERKN